MKKINFTRIFIFLFLGVFVLYPILSLFSYINLSDLEGLLSSISFKRSLFNSLFISSISTFISILIAYILAYTLNRCNIKYKNVLRILIIIPMLIPSISHGIGLINLFGSSGIISSRFSFNIVGPIGIILGSVIYSFPVSFIMLDDGFRYIDNSMYENAKVLGLSKIDTFWKVTMCYLKRPLLSSVFATFTLIFTDYGIPLAVGGKFSTLPVYLYKEVLGLLNYSKGTLISLFLLIPSFISFIFDTFSRDYIDNEIDSEYKITMNKKRDIFFKVITFCILIFVFIILFSFIYYAFINNVKIDRSFSFKHFKYVLDNDIFKYVKSSLIISLFTSIIGTFITFISAYITSRTNSKLKNIIHIILISTLSIPGLVLGLSYTITYSNSFIYNTYAILIIANIIHFMASPYLMCVNALKKVDSNFEDVGKTYNISNFRIILDVIIPGSINTIREMFGYFFVNSMVTISAVAFLFNTSTKPLSLLINDYKGSMMLGEASFVSLIILIINIFVKVFIYKLNNKRKGEI